ncbi:glucose 1-dehydrogenase [Georgenia ruanii]|nr:glucose 1-dehydrogenase [Georgenia ruanii]
MNSSSDQPLAGKVALVTGATKGLGLAMVTAFARAGADVVVSSRKQDSCDEVAARIRTLTGRRAVAVACHVGRWAAVDALVERVYTEFDAIDVLVNNAGMSPTYPSLPDVTEELFDKVVGVNLKGAFRLGSLVGARMAAGRGGSIINVSAVGSIRPTWDGLPYSAAKAGLDTLTVGFAQAFGPSVRANSLMPGAFATELAETWSEEFRSNLASRGTLDRVGDPEEIVGAALYLASDASSFTSGSVLRVDGGMAVKVT